MIHIERTGTTNIILDYFTYFVGLVGGLIHYSLGGYDKALEFLVWMVVIDLYNWPSIWLCNEIIR